MADSRLRGKSYLESEVTPRYPFGFGLSYTSFQYANLTVTPCMMGADEEAIVSVDVTNVGDCVGAEVIQLYITDCLSTSLNI
ncbi:MAG: hypothetical protein K6T85_00115 [Gorillibacterium sp.]|nr:hypothetical protein [Gorillibacterium sp.]